MKHSNKTTLTFIVFSALLIFAHCAVESMEDKPWPEKNHDSVSKVIKAKYDTLR